MKFKKTAALLLTAVFALSTVACSEESHENGAFKNHLIGLKDEEIVNRLLSDYSGMDFSAASYEFDLNCDMAGSAISMTGEASVKSDEFSFSSVLSAGEMSVKMNTVFVDGVLYTDALGVKSKTTVSAEEAKENFSEQLSFVLEDLSVFEKRDLLRSEKGSYVVVLSQPRDELASLLKLDSFLGENSSDETNDAYVSYLGECYCSLTFSEDGVLQKLSMGIKASFVSEGVESELTVDLVYRVLTTDPAEISLNAPKDLSSYRDLSSDETNGGSGSGGSSSGSSDSGTPEDKD